MNDDQMKDQIYNIFDEHDGLEREAIQEFIKKGFDINQIVHQGAPLLILACERQDDPTTADYLLGLGANVNVTDTDGKTALMIALERGYPDIVKLLLEYKADINAKDAQGNTVVTYAAMEGGYHVEQQDYEDTPIELLWQHGAHIHLNTRNSDGQTPLMFAADCGHANMVKWLLAQGADFSVIDKHGNTAFSLATQADQKHANRRKVVKLLEPFVHQDELDGMMKGNKQNDELNTL